MSRVLVTPYALAVSVPYTLAVGFVAAEVAWLARRPGPDRAPLLRSAASAAGMAVGAFGVGLVYTPLLRLLWGLAGRGAPPALAAFWSRHVVLCAVVAFVGWDLSGWVYHVIGHRTAVGWAAHQAHHSGPSYDATLGLRESWAPFHGLLHHPLLALLGLPLRYIIVCAAFSNAWQVMEHTSLPVRFPRWLAAAVMTPGAHRHHHGRGGALVNLGPFLTVWDRLAGTWVPASVPAPLLYGPAVPAPLNPVRVELAGWLALARRYAHLLRPRPVPTVDVP
ncbi:MAG TPA: sterol desaturase family protein [Mycobacteriales bacterium]|nr:sterol desaturase family protein [Mycobacteriales bacterium]